jgi:hypothetical protein
MRGGATIFFASRLIAESANEDAADDAETEEAMPSLLPSPAAAQADSGDRPAERDKLEEMETALAKRWIWRMGLVMVGVVGMLVIVFLFFFEYNIASKNAASQTRQALAGKLAELESLAITLDAVAAPATSPGQTEAEMRKFLEDFHLPNPPAWPALVAQPKSSDVVTVAAERWENVPVAHFTVQNGVNLSHLGIVHTADLHLKDGAVEIFSGTHGAYHEEIWGDKDFTYIQLTPAQPKP